MKFKLKSYFDDRIPLSIYRRNNVIYFQTQTEVARADRLRRMVYSEEKYKADANNIKEIGMIAADLLKRFEDMGDLSIPEFEELVGMDIEQYESIPRGEEFLKFFGAKDYKDFDKNYTMCSIEYSIPRRKYTFILWWYKRGYHDSSDSMGEKGVLTFDTPLEFTDHSDPEMLGAMITEALDRSRKIGDKIAGNPYPEKTFELLSERKLTVQAPRDRHFIDEEDNGICELYQLYGYYPREDSEERSAGFYIGFAAELDCDISEDNIRNAWEKLHGKAEFFEAKPAEHGIFKFRAELRNKKVHRISYFLQFDENELLDCTMELYKPSSRKKLDEKLSSLFEEFARSCRLDT